MNEWTPPRVPTGGGFATAVYSLDYFYEQFQLYNNIWTSSNVNYDLCRFTGSTLTFYRHPYFDFVVTYQRQYPMSLNIYDYYNTHPHFMLLQQHKIIIHSLKNRPHGKPYKRKKIKPPKQLVNKWFFQHSFASKPLLLLKVAVCDLSHPHLGPNVENELASFICLQTKETWQDGAWGQTKTGGYHPIITWTATSYKLTDYKGITTTLEMSNDYTNTINIKSGWFQPKVLQSKYIQVGNSETTYPITVPCRYNPKQDTGKGNAVWLSSISTHDYNQPTTDKILIAQNKPLWLLLYGFTDFIKKYKAPTEVTSIYYLLLQSPSIRGGAEYHGPYLPLDDSFIQGRSQYGSTPTKQQESKWYPTLEHQYETINNIVKCGPYIPRVEGKTTNWELQFKYIFFFKWGGAQDTTKKVADPSNQPEYIVPDNQFQTVQIADPQQQIPESILHPWDFRRGLVTPTALKRMSDNLPIEQIISTDADHPLPPKIPRYSKKEPQLQEKETKEILCLQQLFSENIYQETPEETEDPVLKLIHQQQLQQQQLKLNLLTLMADMKKRQTEIQLQTGILE